MGNGWGQVLMLNLECDKVDLSILFSPNWVIFYVCLIFFFPHIDNLLAFFFSSPLR